MNVPARQGRLARLLIGLLPLALLLLLLEQTSAANDGGPHKLALPSAPRRAGIIRLEPITFTGEVLTDLTHAGDNRIFFSERDGRVRIWDPDLGLLPAPFLDISSGVSTIKEQGLAALAFDPDYAQNGRFYISYTDLNGDTHISRFLVSADPNVADPNSEETLLFVPQPSMIHNGGSLLFGPQDGYLYVAMGDGGYPNPDAPNNAAQDGQSLLGKLLRLDVSGPSGYAIPADNPFVANAGIRDEIWALGLRNPWRVSIDPVSGAMFIADVGLNRWEEIDRLPAGAGGANFGWPCYEGNQPYAPATCGAVGPFTFPIHEYAHDESACSGSVIGGFVYRGAAMPDLNGAYLFADFCRNYFWRLTRAGGGTWTASGVGEYFVLPTAFGLDAGGELYLVDVSGAVNQILRTHMPMLP